MTDTLCSATLAAFIFLSATGVAGAQRGFIAGGPDNLSGFSSLGDAIAAAGKLPLHIIQIHGIGAYEAGDSHELQKKLCKDAGFCSRTQPVREYAQQGTFSPKILPDYKYMGLDIWDSSEEWAASAPFVDHYLLSSKDGKKTLMVDEINWWPLVFAVKCRNIIRPEAGLAGLQKEYLGYCTRPTKRDDSDGIHYVSYNWMTKESGWAPESETEKGAPAINKSLKVGLLDWRLADAELASGAFRGLLVDAVNRLLVMCAGSNADGSHTDNWKTDKDQQFILITHSLGSYLALSTLGLDLPTPQGTMPTSPTPYIYAHTSLMYFFANQIPLLELGDIEPPPDGSGDGSGKPIDSTQVKQNKYLETWAKLRKDYLSQREFPSTCPLNPQIIAWNDPSDLLTYRVPKIDDALVVNLYVQNATHWFWIFEGPITAHDNYVKNKHVLRAMLDSTEHGCNY